MDRSRRTSFPKPGGGSTKASGTTGSKPAPLAPARQRQYAAAAAPSKPSLGGTAAHKSSAAAGNKGGNLFAPRGGSKPLAGPPNGRSATANTTKPPTSTKPPLPGRGSKGAGGNGNKTIFNPTNNNRASAAATTKRSVSAYDPKKPAPVKKSQHTATAVPKSAKNVMKTANGAVDHPIVAPKPTLYAAPMEELLSEATRLKRIKEWRERFLHMKFYFDGIEFAKAFKLKQMILNLGGVS